MEDNYRSASGVRNPFCAVTYIGTDLVKGYDLVPGGSIGTPSTMRATAKVPPRVSFGESRSAHLCFTDAESGKHHRGEVECRDKPKNIILCRPSSCMTLFDAHMCTERCTLEPKRDGNSTTHTERKHSLLTHCTQTVQTVVRTCFE